MIVLGVDSSSVSGACAVVKDGEVLASGFVNNGLTHSQTLMPLLAETLSKAGISPRDIDMYSVSKGPGSFTGLRIGMATVKGLAAANNTDCVGVSTLNALAMGAVEYNGIICPVMDARRSQVYNALFSCEDGQLTRLCDDRAVSISSLLTDIKKYNESVILVGDGAVMCYNEFKSQAENVILADESIRYLRGESVALLGIIEIAKKSTPNDLMPVYLRLPQAERELKSKKAN